MPRVRIVVICTTAFVGALGANAGENVDGEWARDDGQLRTLIGSCGENICAANTWVKNPQGDERVGDRLVMTLRETEGKGWEGTAFDPQRNRSYSMKLSLSGNKMTTRGCILGGILCRDASWTRFGS
jgi:uncharacterized protein (DUF2147 family)